MEKAALVVGISQYPHRHLNNPANDAEDLGNKLRSLGFDTLVHQDLNQTDFRQAITNFYGVVAGRDVGLFFFAGHGLELDGKNYLACKDTDFGSKASVQFTSIPLSLFMENLDGCGVNTKVIILDACRENPFPSQWRTTGGTDLATLFAAKGTLISYATSPGQRSADGQGRNGRYTEALLKHIGTPGVSLEELFKRVRNSLSIATDNQQISWEHTSLMGDFYFNPALAINGLTGSYTQNALKDYQYISSFDLVGEVITDLKSHNWYTQNATISKLYRINEIEARIDDLFVLGRNIYQAACGNANDYVDFTENLVRKLDRFSLEKAIHILNGMAFEIYFDSRGAIRREFKTERYAEVFTALHTDKFRPCCDFLAASLRNHLQRIFYLPGSREVVVLNVVVGISDGHKYLSSVQHYGIETLHDLEGELILGFDTSSDYFRQVACSDLQADIAERCAIPRQYLQLVFEGEAVEEDESIVVPFEYRLQNYSG